MNINRLLTTILVVLPTSPILSAQYAKLTPQWAKQNPGRLTLDTGTAMGGWNDYTFRLHFDSPKIFSLSSQVLLRRKNKEGHIPLHTFSRSLTKPNAVLPIRIRTPSFTPAEDSDKEVVVRADARVHIVARHLDSDGNPTARTEQYDLQLSDFENVYRLPEHDDESRVDDANGG